MKTWIIIGVFLLLIVGSFFTVNALQSNQETQSNDEPGSCGGSCQAENNCGSSTCGVVQGTGSCGCSG